MDEKEKLDEALRTIAVDGSKEMIGAWVEATDGNDNYMVRVSFGTYLEDSGCDSFGIDDEQIAYYLPSVEELAENGLPDPFWVVVSWTVIWRVVLGCGFVDSFPQPPKVRG